MFHLLLRWSRVTRFLVLDVRPSRMLNIRRLILLTGVKRVSRQTARLRNVPPIFNGFRMINNFHPLDHLHTYFYFVFIDQNCYMCTYIFSVCSTRFMTLVIHYVRISCDVALTPCTVTRLTWRPPKNINFTLAHSLSLTCIYQFKIISNDGNLTINNGIDVVRFCVQNQFGYLSPFSSWNSLRSKPPVFVVIQSKRTFLLCGSWTIQKTVHLRREKNLKSAKKMNSIQKKIEASK